MFESIILLAETVADNGVTATEIISILKDVATIAALIGGLILGHRGLKKYLLDDIIKKKVNDVSNSNKKAKNLTNKIIQTISDKEDLIRPADEADEIHIKSLTKELVEVSKNASSEVYSLAFLLHETIKGIKLKIKKKTKKTERYERRVAADYYALVQRTCIKINSFAANIVDIPKSRKTVKYYEIKKEIRRYLSKTGFETLKNYKTGLDLNPNSAVPLIYYNILNKSSSDYIFNRRFFQTLQNNTPIIYHLFVNKIYFPLSLKRINNQIPFGDEEVHLIKVQKKEEFTGNNKNVYFYEFTYSNLTPLFNFVDSMDENILKQNFVDSYISKNSTDFSKYLKKFSLLGDESFTVRCDVEDVENYFHEIKREFKKKLKSLK